MNITLASNSELESRHPQNTPSHFYNTLSSEIILEGQYEVGIKRIIYENNMRTIVTESCSVGSVTAHKKKTFITKNVKSTIATGHMIVGTMYYYVYAFNLTDKVWSYSPFPFPDINWVNKPNYKIEWNIADPKRKKSIVISKDKIPNVRSNTAKHLPIVEEFLQFWHDEDYFEESWNEINYTQVKIPPKFYAKVDDLVSTIQLPNNAKILYDRKTDRIKVDMGDETVVEIKFENGLEYVLGFRNKTLKRYEQVVTAEYRYNLNRGMFAIFVYSNVADFSHVGHTKVPLLDIISIPPASQPGDVVAIDNTNPIFTPVRGNILQEIEIQLCTDSGELLPFTEGKTLVTLHLRPINKDR